MKTTTQSKKFSGLGMFWAALALLGLWLGAAPNALAFPPQITSQPMSQAVQVGSNATFVVVATTSNGALTYQWYFQSNVIAGATNNAYTRTNAQLAHAGLYHVRVTNADGTVNSTNALLTVNDAPSLSGANDLSAIFPNDVNNAGTLVSNLIADRVTDPNPGALQGIAVVAVNNANGAWQYSTNGGTGWSAFGTPTEAAARLLAASASSRVRFAPGLNFVGTVTNGLTFRAWDQTSGTNGGNANIGIVITNTVRDQFSAENFGNNDGTRLWSTNWIESESGAGGPTGGNIKVQQAQLQITAQSTGDNIYREANLSGATAATLSYFYDSSGFGSTVELQIQVSTNSGVSHTTLKAYGSSSGTGTENFNLTPYISANTRIRFFVSSGRPSQNLFRTDEIQIAYSSPGGGATAFSTNSASASVTVLSAADVTTTMTGPASVYAGSNFTYTITVTNSGPTPATNVVVSDILPAGLGVVSVSGGGSIVAGGGLGQVVFDRASSNNVSGVTNWTHVTTSAGNRLLLVGISFGKSSGLPMTPSSVTALTYGGVNLTKVLAETNSNDTTKIISSELWQLVNPPSGTNTVALTFAGAPTTLVAGAATFSGVDPASPLGDSAAVVGPKNKNPSVTVYSATNEIVFDVVSANKNAISLADPGQTRLWSLAGSEAGAASIKPGANLVTNSWFSGNNDWIDLAVSIKPAGLIGQVTWTIPVLAAGVTTNFTLTVTAPLSGSLSNVVASTSTTTDSNPANNDGSAASAQVVSTVLPNADLVTTQSGLTSIAPLANYTYTVTVSNAGPTAASNVVVSDTLAPTLTYISSSGGGSYLAGVVTWPTLVSLPRGAVSNFTVTVRSPISGSLTNTASSTSPTADPNTGNNDGSASEAQVITAVSPLQVANTSKGAAVQTLNWSHTVDPGSSRILIVGLSIDSTSATVNSATFAGFPTLTLIGQTNSGQTKVLMYRMLNPQVGTYPISISLSTAVGIVGGAASFNGVNQANPIASFVGKSSTGTNASLSVSSALGGVVVDVIAPKSPRSATNSGPAQSEQWNLSGANFSGAGSSSYGAATVTPSWELSGATNWAMAAVALNSATVLADVTLSASGPASVTATSNLTYTITVTNLGASAASNVVVSDVLPAGAIFVSASSGGTNNGGVVSWPTLVNFVNGARTNYTVTIQAPTTGTLTNIVYGISTTADPDPSNNNGSSSGNQVVTSVTPQADIVTTVTGPSTVLAGADFVYTVTVTNAGPSPADNVVVSNTLPAAVAFVGASDGGTLNAGVVTWSLATLASAATSNFTVTVTAPASGTLSNTVAGTSAATDLVPSNNNGSSLSARVLTTVTPVADIATTVTGPANVLAAAPFNYTVTVTNGGPSTASGLLVSNTLPAAVQFVSASGGGSNDAGVVVWSIPTLASGATSNFTVTVTAPSSGTLSNMVAGTSATSDPVLSNNDGSSPLAQVITTVTPVADIATTVTGPTNVMAVAPFSYTITVTNAGPSSAANVVVSDTLPAGATFVSASDGGSHLAGVVTWSLATLSSGATSNLIVTVTAPSSGTLSNTVASTSATSDPVSSNNDGSFPAAQVITTVTPPADIATTVTGPTSVLTNATFSYTVTLANLGPAGATGVVVSDTLPAGVIFVGASSGGTQNAGVVTWPELASLANGASSNFTVTVTAPAGGILTNRVSSVSGTSDTNPSNNDGSAPAAIVVTGIYPSALLTGRQLPGGDYQIDFQTFPNTIFSIETSTNLVDWINLITTNSGDGHVIFMNQDVPLYPRRFYRSRQ